MMSMSRRGFTVAVLLAALGCFAFAVLIAFDTPIQAQQTSRAMPIRATNLLATKVAVNGSGATLDTIHCDNLNTTPVFLQLFNAASANVTVGTTAPTLSFGIAVSGSLPLAGTNIWFGTAVTAAATTTATGSSAPSIGIDCNFGLR